MSKLTAMGTILCALLLVSPVGAGDEDTAKAAPDSPAPQEAETPDADADAAEDGDGTAAITAGYDKTAMNGFFIQSEDEAFRLNIGAYTQVRYDVNWREAPADEDDTSNDFSVRRTRFFFEGQYTPSFNYHLRMQIDNEDDF